MARITQTIDDLSGETLSEEVDPTEVTVDGTKYEIDLGSASKDKFIKWLSGEGALIDYRATKATTTTRRTAAVSDDKYSKDDKAAARHWAIDTKYEFTSQTGEKKTLGEKGRIPDAVMTAWEEAGKPQIPND